MQANLETLSSLERRLSVTLPLEKVNTEVESRLKRLARTVKLHGFRPGKVPMKIVEQQFGGQVRQEVLGDAVQHSFGEAVKEKNLRVAGYPRIEVKPGDAPADQFEYIATFEVYPEVAIGELAQVKIERPVVSIGDAEVDKTSCANNARTTTSWIVMRNPATRYAWTIAERSRVKRSTAAPAPTRMRCLAAGSCSPTSRKTLSA